MASLTTWRRWAFPTGARWNKWRPLTAKNIQQVPQGPGAYVLGLPNGRTIQRLLATDVHGLLDVGEARRLQDRLDSLLRCASTKGETGHMAGWRLGTLGLRAALGIEPHELRFAWCKATSKDEAYRIEGTVLQVYYDLFGELPPLNYKFNWSTYEDS